MSWQGEYLDRFYRRRPGWVDGTTEFHDLCRRFLPRGGTILEIGAGSANPTSAFLATVAGRLVGLDPDPRIKGNNYLTEAVVHPGGAFPFAEGTFDGAVADYVLEHVEDPEGLLREIRRVLRPGGAFLFRTPNAWHYVSLLARLLPGRLSTWARRRDGAHPVYRKYYRCNTARRCGRLLANAGFRVVELRLVEKEPSYGLRWRGLFWLMLGYERLVNSTEALRFLRANILGAAVKPE